MQRLLGEMKKKNHSMWIIYGIWLCVTYLTYADVNKDLQSFFDSLGSKSNLTSPGVYKDQAAGYYTGGSLFVRNRVRNQQLATLQMPNVRMGCGGIDIFTGGLSFIGGQQFIETMRSIGSNVSSYAFILGLKTVSPVIEDTLRYLQSVANDINQFNLNSCDAAAGIIGSVWPKHDRASRHFCETMGSQSGLFSDRVKARHLCSKDTQKMYTSELKKKHPLQLGDEFNLAWEAIKHHPYLKSQGVAMAQFFMSLSGTLIATEDSVHEFVSLVDDNNLLKTLMEGGSSTIYQCLEPDLSKACLNIQKNKKIVIAPNQSLIGQVRQVLSGMLDKIFEDKPLSEAEKGFLNSTSLPVYKMLNVVAAFKKGQAPLQVEAYSEAIALDMLYQYVTEILQIMQESVAHLEKIQISSAYESFKESLMAARMAILQKRSEVYRTMQVKLKFIEETRLIEKQLAGQLDWSD